jgi:hypothetical protein
MDIKLAWFIDKWGNYAQSMLNNYLSGYLNFCFQIFILHNSRCQVFVAAVESCPVLHFSDVIFFWPSGSLMPALLSVENGVSLKPVLGGVGDVARIHYPSCTYSIKSILQFSCHFVVINASEGSICFQISLSPVRIPEFASTIHICWFYLFRILFSCK